MRTFTNAIFVAFTLPFTVVDSFSSSPVIAARRVSTVGLRVAQLHDADFSEMMIGGERYEMVPLPDSMVDTTLFVGNLCEFVKDGDLSALFATVSNLQSVPACVARKANYDSLHYGFVTFPNIEEKEKAIIKFHKTSYRGKILKVEPIRDDPRKNRVRVPEKMVAYMCGAPKKTSDGRVNTLRRVSRAEVDRMSKGKKGRNNKEKVPVPMRLKSDKDFAELQRASRKGYLTLLSNAYRRGRKNSALANVHRELCDASEKPQIVLCKATGGRPLDHVIVDLSPLRIHGLLDNPTAAEDFLIPYKTQILLAAEKAGMELRDDYVEDNTISSDDDVGEELQSELVVTLNSEAWATKPIWSLPTVSVGVFEGQRGNAKAMARELAELWEIPETTEDFKEGDAYQRGGKTRKDRHKKRKSRRDNHRRRDKNHYDFLV